METSNKNKWKEYLKKKLDIDKIDRNGLLAPQNEFSQYPFSTAKRL